MSRKRVKLGFRIHTFIIWPLISCLILFILSMYAIGIDRPFGVVALLAAFFNLIVFGVMYFFTRKYLIKETLELSTQISDIQKEHLMHFDIPHCLLDPNGIIAWSNDAFYDLVEDPKNIGKSISEYFESIKDQEYPTYEQPVEFELNYNDKTLKFSMHQHHIETERSVLIQKPADLSYYSVYIYDVTMQKHLEVINTEQKTIISYIYVDNYEEILQSVEEVRRPLLVAMIDRNLNAMAKDVSGILSKIEKDKYIFIFQKKYIKKFADEKYKILDDIREISIGNELPVTISIGVGIHDHSYTIAQEYARTAIDLALGRGGDQAVIKNNDKFSFYGGRTRGVETNTRVKARIKSYAFRELITEADNVLIMGHQLGDLDSLGAAMGVYACARLLDKKVNIVLNTITTAIKVLYDQIMESDHFPDSIFVSGSKSVELCGSNTLVVIVDVNRPSYLEYPELLKYTNNVVVFDHHRVSTEYIEPSVLSYIEPYASSTSEMITEILRYITDKVKLDPLEADALFAGISVDTKNFIIKTGVKTFEAAAFLKRNGADLIRVRKFFQNDMETYKAKASAVKDAIIYREKIAISQSPANGTNPTLAAAQAADELLNISGIKASFVLTQLNHVIYISARSFDAINVQLIMEKLGGGGHLSVAGAQLEDISLEEAKKMLQKAIDEFLEEGEEE
jgi:c-di-AMP phosphodiesterase-like protein